MPTRLPMLAIRRLGLVPYAEAVRLQEELVAARANGDIADTLLLLEHPPVLTAGRGTGEGSLKVDLPVLARRGLDVVSVARGGDVTWHGPGQLVGYPICDLGGHGRDLHRFLRGLEAALIDSLKRFGIDSHRTEGRTGVWVSEAMDEPDGQRASEPRVEPASEPKVERSNDQKIASIGIAVRRWVSYHGFALNVSPSLEDFGLIHPCGLTGVRMTSMHERLGDACPAFDEVMAVVAGNVASQLGYAGVREDVHTGAAA